MIRLTVAFLLVMLCGCSKDLEQNSPMPSSQPENTLAVKRDGAVVNFPVSEAVYNWKREEHGVEFTLMCRTAELADQDYEPNLEVTIVLADEPNIKVGSEWLNQPAYVEKNPLYNLTNYYEWTHEGFEDFSVSIRHIDEDTITCHITGYVSLNTSGDDPTLVSIVARFKHDESVERGVQ